MRRTLSSEPIEPIIPKKAKPFNKRDQRDEKDERDDNEVADNARQCGAHDSDNADTRSRSRPYRLSCPSRPKITRDEKDERDDSEVVDNARGQRTRTTLMLVLAIVSSVSLVLFVSKQCNQGV